MNKWRLILSPPLDGATNMAIDVVLSRAASTPFLRFYSWGRPTLSLGYFQKADEALINRCKENDVDLVRRPTGGRAVLHHHELTYSVGALYEHFLQSSTLKSLYTKLAGWQLRSLKEIGIDACLSDGRSTKGGYARKEACFLTSTPYELLVSGKKICGSAQKRGNNSFLQHGSILSDCDDELFCTIFGEESSYIHSFTTLKREGYPGTKDELIEVLSKQFRDVVGCNLAVYDLTGEELADAAALRSEYIF